MKPTPMQVLRIAATRGAGLGTDADAVSDADLVVAELIEAVLTWHDAPHVERAGYAVWMMDAAAAYKRWEPPA